MIYLNEREVVKSYFPDGTADIKIDNEWVLMDNTIRWNYENMGELFIIQCINNIIRQFTRVSTISLIIPYVPYAREDKKCIVDSPLGNTNPLKFLIKTINSMFFDFVYIKNPHSMALKEINNCKEMNYASDIEDIINKHKIDMLFLPDEGCFKKIQEYLLFGLKIGYGQKRRNAQNNIINYKVIGDFDKQKILIIDDICSKGGTFYEAATLLKTHGASEIYLYVTHCENNILNGELVKSTSPIKKIYTTDSIFTKEHEKIEIINN